ncbi:hypothetical protein EDC14_101418 [Hydrogenispora ethanolica]|jgi:hypothetical protein|uniref:Uncharacterized protein n=1 Tax=Hydrogenispora ethanolica TaxID=1082276 RepID=A0A4R1RN52_HYDET|nr:hypothetical protein [Hydrogenispora ethanolica]TCL67330.1 hypothetical protein EDC14_101418 [Hydrogenispora ethanolica]
MKKRSRSSLTFVLCFVLVFSLQYYVFASATPAPPAKVYFIRQLEAAQAVYLFSDAQFLCLLKRNTYFLATIDPGLHLIWLSTGAKSYALNEFELVPGQTYYIDISNGRAHSLLNRLEGLQLLQRVGTPAASDEKAAKRAVTILEKHYGMGKVKPDGSLKATIKAMPETKDEPGSVDMPRFTPLKLSLVGDIASNAYQTNDRIPLEVSENVMVQDQLLIPKGTPVNGIVWEAHSRGSFGQPGHIDIVIPEIELDEATRIPIIGRYIDSGVSRMNETGGIFVINGQDIAGSALISGILSTGFNSLVKGTQAMIPAGTEFTVWTRYPVRLKPRADQAPAPPSPRDERDEQWELLKSRIPSQVLFPLISAPQQLDSAKAYQILFSEIHRYQLGNSISQTDFAQFEAAAYQRSDQNEIPAAICARIAGGFYLRVNLDVAPNQIDKAVFELFDPNAPDPICRVKVSESFGLTYNDSAKKLLRKGVKKLAKELKKVRPDLVAESP